MTEAQAASRYLVIAYGETERPVMEIVQGLSGVRSAVARMCFGSEKDADWEAVDAYLHGFGDGDHWDFFGVRFDIDFEAGGIEITQLLID